MPTAAPLKYDTGVSSVARPSPFVRPGLTFHSSFVTAYLVSALLITFVKCVQIYSTSGLYCFQLQRCPSTKWQSRHRTIRFSFTSRSAGLADCGIT